MAANRVVVVGAGVMGTWTARWLRRRGHEVVTVDQHEPASSVASSGDESRVTRSAHGSDELYPRWQRHALEQWRLLEEEAHLAVFLQCGTLWLAHRADGFEGASLATLPRLGIPFERLDQAELRRRWPQLDANEIGWALYEPEGGLLLARRAVAALAGLLCREGGEVVRDRVLPPREADAAGGRLRLLRGAAGTELGADAFVLAAGPWLPGLLPGLEGLELEVTRQEVIYFATPPGDARFDAAEFPTWCDYDGAFYGVPSIEGRGFKVAPDWPGPVVDPDHVERRLSDERVEAARGLLRARFPALAAQPVAEGRICQYETTADTHFVIDRHPAWDNVWVVGGGSGHAFKHGPTIGEYAAGLVTDDRATLAALGPPDDRFALRHRSPGQAMRTSGTPPTV